MQVNAACKDTPIIVLAGINARHRLVQALAHPDVVGIVPKIGAWSESATMRAPKLEGPDEQALGLALRRRIERAVQPSGPRPTCSPAPRIEERLIGELRRQRGDPRRLLADAARFGLSDEKVRRIETAADELMLNAVYDAPRDERGDALHADIDRRTPVCSRRRRRCARAGDATAAPSSSASPIASARSTAPPYRQRPRAAPALDARSPRLGRGGPAQPTTTGGAGLGLVLTYSAANQLSLQVSRGRFTRRPPRCTSAAVTAPRSLAAPLSTSSINRDTIGNGSVYARS